METDCVINFKLPGKTHGWLNVDLSIGECKTDWRASSVEIGTRSAGVAEFILAFASFCILGTPQSLTFEPEGTIEPILRFDRTKGSPDYLMRIRMGYHLMAGWYPDENEDNSVYFDATCEISTFAKALSSAAREFFSEVSIEEYNDRWANFSQPYAMPMHQQYLQLLEDATRRYFEAED